MIVFDNVTKAYGEQTAVDRFSLTVPPGSCFCLLGPNGAGKTTLLRMLVGLIEGDSGAITIGGVPMKRSAVELKARLGVVSQHINLDKELTVAENLEFTGRLYRMPKARIRERMEELMGFMGLSESRGKLSRQLSGGMKRKLMIARALMHSPEILLLDEPTVGIDTTGRRKIWDILRELHRQGKTLILTTHYIEEAEALCDSVALMHEGRLFDQGTPKGLIAGLGNFTVETFRDHHTEYAYFPDRTSAKSFSAGLEEPHNLRRTTLDDVFFQFAKRMVG